MKKIAVALSIILGLNANSQCLVPHIVETKYDSVLTKVIIQNADTIPTLHLAESYIKYDTLLTKPEKSDFYKKLCTTNIVLCIYKTNNGRYILKRKIKTKGFYITYEYIPEQTKELMVFKEVAGAYIEMVKGDCK